MGSSFIIEHQRLSGLGYCFSASLPPLLASAAITSLDIIEKSPELLKKLKENSCIFDKGLKKIEALECISFAESPVKHLYVKSNLGNDNKEKLLKEISDKCFERNLAIVTPAYLRVEKEYPRPSLRICISAALNQSDIDFSLNTLEKCVSEVLCL